MICRPAEPLHRRRRNGGFSLLELLVAFTIAATSLVLLMTILGRASGMTARESQAQRAESLAQSLLIELPITEPTIEFERTGVFDETFAWIVSAERFERATASVRAESVDQGGRLDVISLQRVEVSVTWQGRGTQHSISLSTLRPVFSDGDSA